MSNKKHFSFPLIRNIERIKYLELYHNLANIVAIPLLAAFFILPDEKGNIIMSLLMPLLLSIPLVAWFTGGKKKEQRTTLHIDSEAVYITSPSGEETFRKQLSAYKKVRLHTQVPYHNARWKQMARLRLIHPVTYIECQEMAQVTRFYIEADSDYQLKQLEKSLNLAALEQKENVLSAKEDRSLSQRIRI